MQLSTCRASFDFTHHRFDLVEIAIFRRTPCSTHAETRGAIGLGFARGFNDGFEFHQRLFLQAGFKTHGLWAVAAIFRASARL